MNVSKRENIHTQFLQVNQPILDSQICGRQGISKIYLITILSKCFNFKTLNFLITKTASCLSLGDCKLYINFALRLTLALCP